MRQLCRHVGSSFASGYQKLYMSSRDFALLHINNTLFVRPVPTESGSGYAVYGADGTLLDVVKTMGEVILSAHSHDMDVDFVH